MKNFLSERRRSPYYVNKNVYLNLHHAEQYDIYVSHLQCITTTPQLMLPFNIKIVLKTKLYTLNFNNLFHSHSGIYSNAFLSLINALRLHILFSFYMFMIPFNQQLHNPPYGLFSSASRQKQKCTNGKKSVLGRQTEKI